ncbi:Uu.00g146490.m01.CDS01 [Anthostomella pinea]|uniref:Uu.00g146490.m01.CDS01 n=1 Tax=Anthostomella pinea TaxID=933095 RepID=A0AAI8VRA6_9PEZI|nr:Uu.00g146490.m01.CDS01 [Anthostomella pinea]
MPILSIESSIDLPIVKGPVRVFFKLDLDALHHFDPTLTPFDPSQSITSVLRKARAARDVAKSEVSEAVFGTQVAPLPGNVSLSKPLQTAGKPGTPEEFHRPCCQYKSVALVFDIEVEKGDKPTSVMEIKADSNELVDGKLMFRLERLEGRERDLVHMFARQLYGEDP